MRGATGPVIKAISKRRSHRQQWRIFECIAMILLDGTLIAAAFSLAYYVRFYILGNSSLVKAIFCTSSRWPIGMSTTPTVEITTALILLLELLLPHSFGKTSTPR